MGKTKKVGILGKQASSRHKLSQRGENKPSGLQRGPKKPPSRALSKDARALSQTCRLSSPLHQQCSKILEKLLRAREKGQPGATVKGLCLAPAVQNKAAVFAVVCETLRYHHVLTCILEAALLVDQCPEISEAAAFVLLYDHLVGQGVKPRGRIERQFLKHQVDIEVATKALLSDAGVASLPDLLKSTASHDALPRERAFRCVRANTLSTPMATSIAELRAPPPSWPQKHQQPLEITPDEHVAHAFHVPAARDLHDHPLVLSGAVILQSKASCMPAHALQVEAGWHVVDCCAAPGNKTTHVAALVGPRGKVFAFERNHERCKTLRATLLRAAAHHVDVHEGDVLKVDPQAEMYRRVKGVLLDPSCSGSGTATFRLAKTPVANHRARATPEAACHSEERDDACLGRRENDGNFPGETSNDEERVQALAAFQATALRHVLQFPALKRLVYSTCSVYRQENEDVVAAVLPHAEALGFHLQRALPEWPRRGLQGTYPWADLVVRVHPELDDTDGFFVALFERP